MKLLYTALLVTDLLVGGCKGGEAPADAEPTIETVSIMTFNVQNLFDNVDDPGKDDKAYLPIEAKQSEEHIAACNEIEVDSWRAECLELDWNDAAIEHKLGVVAEAIRQYDGGRGADIIALQEIENSAILDRLSFDYLGELRVCFDRDHPTGCTHQQSAEYRKDTEVGSCVHIGAASAQRTDQKSRQTGFIDAICDENRTDRQVIGRDPESSTPLGVNQHRVVADVRSVHAVVLSESDVDRA